MTFRKLPLPLLVALVGLQACRGSLTHLATPASCPDPADTLALASYDVVRDPSEPPHEIEYAPGQYPIRYPDELKFAGVEGRVVSTFVLDPAGRVVPHSLRIESATDPRVQSAVCEGLPRMQFRPVKVNGRAVRARVTFPVRFTLNH